MFYRTVMIFFFLFVFFFEFIILFHYLVEYQIIINKLMLQYLRFTMSEVSLIYSVFKILICCFTLIFGIFNPHALKNLCALSWHFVFSLFSFSFNLTYDYFSLFLLALQCLMSTKRSHILKQPCTKGLRVIFLAYHVCLFSKFPFWNISSYQTNIISEENIMFILDFLIKLSSYAQSQL